MAPKSIVFRTFRAGSPNRGVRVPCIKKSAPFSFFECCFPYVCPSTKPGLVKRSFLVWKCSKRCVFPTKFHRRRDSAVEEADVVPEPAGGPTQRSHDSVSSRDLNLKKVATHLAAVAPAGGPTYLHRAVNVIHMCHIE